jgi:hypothetical protein
MRIEKLNPETMYTCAATIRSLGNGRNFHKVLVGDSDDARTAHYYYVGNIYQNWPSWKFLRIKVGDRLKRLDIPKPTINGKPVYIFFWNELTADLWFRQIEREKLLSWFEVAEPDDGIAMAELIFHEAESEHRGICPSPLPSVELSADHSAGSNRDSKIRPTRSQEAHWIDRDGFRKSQGIRKSGIV